MTSNHSPPSLPKAPVHTVESCSAHRGSSLRAPQHSAWAIQPQTEAGAPILCLSKWHSHILMVTKKRGEQQVGTSGPVPDKALGLAFSKSLHGLWWQFSHLWKRGRWANIIELPSRKGPQHIRLHLIQFIYRCTQSTFQTQNSKNNSHHDKQVLFWKFTCKSVLWNWEHISPKK